MKNYRHLPENLGNNVIDSPWSSQSDLFIASQNYLFMFAESDMSPCTVLSLELARYTFRKTSVRIVLQFNAHSAIHPRDEAHTTSELQQQRRVYTSIQLSHLSYRIRRHQRCPTYEMLLWKSIPMYPSLGTRATTHAKCSTHFARLATT
jgi:hypothetical protein